MSALLYLPGLSICRFSTGAWGGETRDYSKSGLYLTEPTLGSSVSIRNHSWLQTTQIPLNGASMTQTFILDLARESKVS